MVSKSPARVKFRTIIIVGPTGSGKTELAIQLARKFHGEIISADSRTVYRGMDIGTAKVARDKEREIRSEGGYVAQGIPHHLIDIRNPDESYSVAEFQRDAERLIRTITRRGRLPIIVGGTGLYITVLVDRFIIPDIPAQPKLRESFEEKSCAELLSLLRRFDPVTARTIDRKNKRRLIRALEVCILTGEPFSKLRLRSQSPSDFLLIGISRARSALYHRLDRRTKAMFRAGLVDEAQRLLERYGPDIEPLRGFIYREVVAWLRTPIGGRPSLRALAQQIACANHQYARRQISWFKKDKRIRWVRTKQQAERLLREFLRGS